MQNYYTTRKPDKPIDFEEAYWETAVDPDGVVRHRSDEREKDLTDRFKQELAFVNSLQQGKILDVGCGTGHFLSGVDSSWGRFGVDVSRYAVLKARKWADVFCGTLKEADFPPAFFDVVSMNYVISHMKNPIAEVHCVRRVLKKDGILILGTPDFDSPCARRFGKNYRLLHDHTQISLFTNESMHRFLRDFGFHIDRVEYPFFDTPYFTVENLMRLFDTSKVSPPFVGNCMTFYAHKP